MDFTCSWMPGNVISVAFRPLVLFLQLRWKYCAIVCFYGMLIVLVGSKSITGSSTRSGWNQLLSTLQRLSISLHLKCHLFIILEFFKHPAYTFYFCFVPPCTFLSATWQAKTFVSSCLANGTRSWSGSRTDRLRRFCFWESRCAS